MTRRGAHFHQMLRQSSCKAAHLYGLGSHCNSSTVSQRLTLSVRVSEDQLTNRDVLQFPPHTEPLPQQRCYGHCHPIHHPPALRILQRLTYMSSAMTAILGLLGLLHSGYARAALDMQGLCTSDASHCCSPLEARIWRSPCGRAREPAHQGHYREVQHIARRRKVQALLGPFHLDSQASQSGPGLPGSLTKLSKILGTAHPQCTICADTDIRKTMTCVASTASLRLFQDAGMV